MKQLEQCILDLNAKRAEHKIVDYGHYEFAFDKLQAMQAAENDHERQLAEIESQTPKSKTIITYTEQDGLRIEHPIKESFSIGQRFALTVIKWTAVMIQ